MESEAVVEVETIVEPVPESLAEAAPVEKQELIAEVEAVLVAAEPKPQADLSETAFEAESEPVDVLPATVPESVAEAEPERLAEVASAVEPEEENIADEDDVDAFDFFTAEPIGSAARELEKQQEAAAVVKEAPEPMEEEQVE